ncbi:aldo/keto reductase [Chitinophaga sp. SYP-B3965]|uniref:aldo/keto reductase n=1 Tax=Chitinophaga sp. SYP-B3965 TaxID=2663120 RepID=UPI001299C37A|nr:aldo/keto reductase [Chitinophaga sp. SYP-B3965]MRG47913.1 aldo/keto reductase [Chitinophaga sp. SYP-B3965]
MEKRTLGNTDIQLAPLVFGGNVFGWTADEPTSFQLLDAFTDAGFNGIDTSDNYTAWIPGNTGGDSERVIGKWLKKSGKRDKVVIATKVGGKFSEEKKGLKKAYILQSIEDSLTRLQTDYIDLYQTHYDDLETPIEETLEAYAEIVRSGKVRAIGTSNMTVERLAESIQISQQKGFPLYQSLQPEYNLLEREKYETQYAPFVTEHNIGVIPFFALASGFLTGKYRSEKDLEGSSRTKYVSRYINERGFKILNTLDEVAAQYNSKPGTVAIAWVMAQPGITAPIASASNMAQFNDLIAAASLKLDASAMELLNTASAY